MPVRKIVFVCTGNICRSPMGEYLLKDRLPVDTEWVVESAGTFAGMGSPASGAGVRAMAEKGIDIGMHRSQPLTTQLAEESDLLIVMAESHREEVMRIDPTSADRVHLLKSFVQAAEGRNVEDPIGMPDSIYIQVRDEIDAAMPDLLLFMHEQFDRDSG